MRNVRMGYLALGILILLTLVSVSAPASVGDLANGDGDITIIASEHGVLETDKLSAQAGETVKITAYPEEGYRVKISTFRILSEDTQVPFETIDSYLFTFVMPESNVIIQTEFERFHKVVFVDGNGSIVLKQDVAHGEDATPPSAIPMKNPSRFHDYVFSEWEDCSNIVSDRTIRSEFTEKEAELVTAFVSMTSRDTVMASPIPVKMNAAGFDLSRYGYVGYEYSSGLMMIHACVAAHEDVFGTEHVKEMLVMSNGWTNRIWGVQDGSNSLALAYVCDEDFPDSVHTGWAINDGAVCSYFFFEYRTESISLVSPCLGAVTKGREGTFHFIPGSVNEQSAMGADVYICREPVLNVSVKDLQYLGKTDDDGMIAVKFTEPGINYLAIYKEGSAIGWTVVNVIDSGAVTFNKKNNVEIESITLDGKPYNCMKDSAQDGQKLEFKLRLGARNEGISSLKVNGMELEPKSVSDRTYSYEYTVTGDHTEISVKTMVGSILRISGEASDDITISRDGVPSDNDSVVFAGNLVEINSSEDVRIMVNGTVEKLPFQFTVNGINEIHQFDARYVRDVSVSETEDGSIHIGVPRAAPGETVRFKLLPDDGFCPAPGTLRINGSGLLTITPGEFPKEYTFLMPFDDVNVSVIFTRGYDASFSVNPPSADVSVWDSAGIQMCPEGPNVFFLAPGTYAYKASATNYDTAEGVIVIESSAVRADISLMISKFDAVFYFGTGIPTEKLRYGPGEAVEFPVPVRNLKPGFSFMGWSLDGKHIESYTMGSRDVIFNAEWERTHLYYKSQQDTDSMISDALFMHGTDIRIEIETSQGMTSFPIGQDFFRKAGKTSFIFTVIGEGGKEIYSWEMSGRLKIGASSFDPLVSERGVSETERSLFSNPGDVLVLEFNTDGILPMDSTFRYKIIGNSDCEFEMCQIRNGTLSPPIGCSGTDQDGYVSFEMSHCSTYALVPAIQADGENDSNGVLMAEAIGSLIAIAAIGFLILRKKANRKG